jgi:hypothetical protein
VAIDNNYSYDFTIAQEQAYGGSLSHAEIEPGIWGMVSGDGNNDGEINNLDKDDVWVFENNQTGYFLGDYDMNSQVNSSDESLLWKANSGKCSMIIK